MLVKLKIDTTVSQADLEFLAISAGFGVESISYRLSKSGRSVEQDFPSDQFMVL